MFEPGFEKHKVLYQHISAIPQYMNYSVEVRETAALFHVYNLDRVDTCRLSDIAHMIRQDELTEMINRIHLKS